MEGHSGHGVHERLGDVLDYNRDVIVPCANRFVIRGSHKSPVFVYECNRIDRSQMLVVFLYDLARVDVVLDSK